MELVIMSCPCIKGGGAFLTPLNRNNNGRNDSNSNSNNNKHGIRNYLLLFTQLSLRIALAFTTVATTLSASSVIVTFTLAGSADVSLKQVLRNSAFKDTCLNWAYTIPKILNLQPKLITQTPKARDTLTHIQT